MRTRQQGFTILGVILFILWLASWAVACTLVYWVIRALMKYVGA